MKTKYQAVLHSGPGKFLLGGVRAHRSIWFDAKADAAAWLQQAVETNEGAGNDVVAPSIVEKEMP